MKLAYTVESWQCEAVLILWSQWQIVHNLCRFEVNKYVVLID